MMIRNILCDMGEVLIRYDTDIILDRYPLTGNDRELLSREVFQSVEWSMLDRGSLAATTIVTNVQDFIAIVAKGLKLVP